MEEAKTISTEPPLTDLIKQSFRRTLDQLQDRVSSIFLLTLQWKDIEDHIDSTHSSMDERVKELHSIHGAIELILNEVKKRERDLELVHESVRIRFREVEDREKEFELIQKKEIQERRKEIEWIERSGKELESVREQIEKKLRAADEVESRFKLFNNCIEEKANQVKTSLSELEIKNENFKEKEKKLEEKEKQLEERYREFEEMKQKEKQSIVVGTRNNNNSACDANLYFTVNMDGKALQIFLNEHRGGEYNDKLRDEVFVALGFSSDPAKLVLDAMQGFYPPHLKKGDIEFTPEVVRKSCIILLEQLMKISPEISPHVRDEAIKLSFSWLTKMKVDAEHSLEVLGFLQLIASYGVGSTFDADELLTQLEIVVQHSLAPGLFRALGFADKISGIIQNLIGKKQHIEAIRVIYVFELVNEFPPVPLLKDYLQCSKNAAKRIRKADSSLKGQFEATKKRVKDLRCASSCIQDYKIECGRLLQDVNKLIVNFEKENTTRIAKLAVSESKKSRNSRKKEFKLRKRKPLPNKKRHLALPIAAPVLSAKSTATTSPDPSCIPSTTSTSVPATKAQSQQLSGTKRPWTDVSAEDDLSASRVADQATCIVPFHEKLEKSSPGDLVVESNKVSPASTPTSAAPPNTQLQQSENKHPRIHVSPEYNRTFVGATSAGHTMQTLQQHPPGLITTHGVPYMHPPPRHYNLAGYPPENIQLNSYNSNVRSSYQWETYHNSGYNWAGPYVHHHTSGPY